MRNNDSAHTGRGSVVTIKDVAAAARVSPSTVSNLLNGRDSRMSAETRTKIEKAMTRLGYRPSRVARSLRTGKVSTVGLVVPSVANPFWGHWAQVIESEALRHNLQLLLCNSERDAERERAYVEELWASGVWAIVLGSSLPSLAHVGEAIREGPLLVAFDRESQVDDPPGLINLSVDNFAGGRLATEHLLRLGHRRIGFISGAMATVSRRRRLAGYESALAETGQSLDEDLIWADSGDGFGDIEPSDLGRRGMQALLDRRDPPTAVVAINDMYALGACAALHEAGTDAPRVSVVGFDDIILAPLYNPPLTTIRQPLPAMAEYAIRVITGEQRAGRHVFPRSVLMQPTLIERASSGPPSQRSRK